MSVNSASPALGAEVFVCWSPEVLAAEVDGETVLMSIERGNYYGMAETANDIWGRLKHPVRVRDLCAALAADYDAPADRIAQETLDFLGRLVAEGLLTVSEA